jgi:hypothetical protein
MPNVILPRTIEPSFVRFSELPARYAASDCLVTDFPLSAAAQLLLLLGINIGESLQTWGKFTNR